MTLDWETMVSASATLIWVVSLGFIPLVLLRRKEASSTIAWILTLVFIPVAGVVLFWFLGRDRVRRPARRKVSSNVALRGRLEEMRALAWNHRLEEILAQQRPEQRGVMRLAARVARQDIMPGNEVELLVGAPATYDAHVAAIEAARDHVHLEFYIFRPDAPGLRILDALVRAAKRGVHVRLLYDGFGSRMLTHHALAPLLRAGGHAAKFLPLDPVRRAWTFNLRNHRKLMIVDGEVGFTGGINVGEPFLSWRDVHLCIRGPAAGQLQRIFVEDWFFATRHDLVHPAIFPEVPASGPSIVQLVESGPDATIEAIQRLLFAAIAGARDRVWLTTPYFVPDPAILCALQTAALRGVDVRLIVPRHSNHRVTFHAGRSFYDALLGAGVKIHEYVPGMVHAKTMIVDHLLATVGSANLDVRSFRLNFELVALMWDQHVVAGLEALFEQDLEKSELVDLAAWRRRGVVLRVKEGVGRLCAPLL